LKKINEFNKFHTHEYVLSFIYHHKLITWENWKFWPWHWLTTMWAYYDILSLFYYSSLDFTHSHYKFFLNMKKKKSEKSTSSGNLLLVFKKTKERFFEMCFLFFSCEIFKDKRFFFIANFLAWFLWKMFVQFVNI